MAFLPSILIYFPISAELSKSIFLTHCNLASVPTLSTLSQLFLTSLTWKHIVNTLSVALITIWTCDWSPFFLGGRMSLSISQTPPSRSQSMLLPFTRKFYLNSSLPLNTEHLQFFSCVRTAATQCSLSLALGIFPRWQCRSGFCDPVCPAPTPMSHFELQSHASGGQLL